MNSKISVIVPCYNSEKYLAQTLDSILTQTHPFQELIVINDCSTDSSMQIVDEYRSNYPKIVLFENSENMGIGYTRQRGLDVAQGDYVAFLSSDDVWHHSFLDESMQLLERGEYPKFGTYTDYFRCDPSLRVLSTFECPEFSRWKMIHWALRKNMFINFSSVVFPNNLPARFEPELRRGEDLIFLLDSVLWGLHWLRVDQPLVRYRVMGGKFDHGRFHILWRYNKDRLVKLGVPEDLVEEAYRQSHSRVSGSRLRRLYRKLRGWIP